MRLETTPIREIIFTISFSETVDMEAIEKFKSLSHISERFSEESSGYHANIKEVEGRKPKTSVSHDGYILKTNGSESKVLHVRRGSFAFHKVKGYETFDNLSNEFRTYWLDFKDCIDHELSVTLITVRYLNFIQKDPTESKQDLVTVYPISPSFSEDMSGFIHLKFQYKDKDSINVNIVTADVKDGREDGIILDIFLNRKVDKEKKCDTLFQFLAEMREIKNDIFFKSITNNTIQKYSK